MMRYFKKCEEFAICSEVGESNFLFPETSDERRTLYQIVVKGTGRVGKIFDSEYTELDEQNNYFVDLKNIWELIQYFNHINHFTYMVLIKLIIMIGMVNW